jgi:bacillithiol biosynthesis deacetylase BshB1
MKKADVLAFGAHPDDVEIGCGGTLIKLTDLGHTVVVVDLVRGELGTRGTAEIRAREAEESAKLLGLHARENLELPDGHVRPSVEAKDKVVRAVRRWRPDAVFLPYWRDRHPDHAYAAQLTYEGSFLAGLPRYDTGQEAHRPSRVFYYMGWYEFEPTFIVDVSAQFERKMNAIYAFGTQFRPDASDDPQTRLTSSSTDWMIRSRMAYYGTRIGRQYGEGFLARGCVEAEHPLEMRFVTF